MRRNLDRIITDSKGCLWRPPSIIALSLPICVILSLITLVCQLQILFRQEPSYTYLGDDRPRDLPVKVGFVNMNFHDDPVRYRLSGAQAWAEWNELRPAGRGYVYLGKSYFSFGVSMWHQLHCLNHLRNVINLGDDGSDHTEHCFHYLRQGILCAADTTLEPGGPSMLLPDGQRIATGVNVTHTCRDWRQVYDWMEDNHAKWTPEMQQRMREPSDGHGGRIMTTK